MSNFEMPSNPAEFAEYRAQENLGDDFDITKKDEMLLSELDKGAEMLDFIDKSYFVESGRAMIVPRSFELSDTVEYTNFWGLTFEGTFRTHSKLHIGRIIGAGSVRAVCLTFTDAILLPYLDRIPESEMLCVPVLAVQSMDLVAA